MEIRAKTSRQGLQDEQNHGGATARLEGATWHWRLGVLGCLGQLWGDPLKYVRLSSGSWAVGRQVYQLSCPVHGNTKYGGIF